MARLRIMLVDDHEVVRLGMESLLEHHAGFEVVAEASTTAEAVHRALVHKPDIVLMDIRLADNLIGHGLVSMHTRAEARGGTLTVDSEPGQGTIVRLKLPVTEEG